MRRECCEMLLVNQQNFVLSDVNSEGELRMKMVLGNLADIMRSYGVGGGVRGEKYFYI